MAESDFAHLRLGRCGDTEWVTLGIIAQAQDFVAASRSSVLEISASSGVRRP
jgi:hypothetical protein